ncbi:hypothetical protein A2223_03680 [Candidatus Falkowbacteria bacterium RIFOXYA2_FULL_35_8]|uniref:FAD/NAD(P)-binding domain-containing protein n=1 Tax=Candidatus Falkowbacteria bacterium RIFOXYC2_FULL_36_12 TaxID=1798002 RepID=A0A1F5T487_9BACT|nr:MAG: hypothetical protein A2478_01365 [Candidatus Falkowbacteria bacterium RIFOXYC2_FULL_36_12]OGF34216.1 MAG: hypothetical protein A2223_03680 [Candidatus Falkowbacteria bacterium RIFOXYA2_FULL_35_8]
MEQYDVVIIGGACAGLTAALYTARRELKTLVITKTYGGQAAITTEIENYPGTGTILGPELMNKFKQQAETAGAQIKLGEVNQVTKIEEGKFEIKSTIGAFESKAVILAYGLEQRTLGVPGEKKLTGRGVAYCATCDAPFFKSKIVGVVGGGNSSFDAAEYLSNIAKKVYLFNRSDKFRAEQVLIDQVNAAGNVESMNFTEIKEFIGEQKLEKVILLNNQTQQETELNLDGVFIEIGWITKTDMIKDLVNLDERGYVIVDNENKTSAPGIFAAGDITNTPFKQAVISAGDGAKAAMSTAKYIQMLRGKNGSIGLAPDLTR